MPVFEIFSKRKKDVENAGQEDVYQYDEIPKHVRVQIHHILEDSIGEYYVPDGYPMADASPSNRLWETIELVLMREWGVHEIANGRNPKDCVFSALENEHNNDRCIDVVEVAFKVVGNDARLLQPHEQNKAGIKQAPDDAIEELNYRLRKGGVGYQFENGQIIRMDSQFVHSEIIKPALSLLSSTGFEGAQEEFMNAHSHYRVGEYRDAITDAGNAFESTMKAICDAREWGYNAGARASDLIKVLRSKGLFPDYLGNSFDQLLAVLKSGLPEVRNNEGPHGQGTEAKSTPGYVAAFALHLAATKIVFLVEAHKSI